MFVDMHTGYSSITIKTLTKQLRVVFRIFLVYIEKELREMLSKFDLCNLRPLAVDPRTYCPHCIVSFVRMEVQVFSVLRFEPINKF